ncbi:SAG family member, partial [Eimeria maxima]
GTDPGVWLTKTDVDLSIAAAIQSSTAGDCAAATKQWKGALKAIGDSLPPAYTPGENIYKSLDVVSFMNLYTPKEGVAVTCTVIQCPYKSSSTESDSSSGHNGANGGTNGNNGQSSQGNGQQSPSITETSTPSTNGAVRGGVAQPSSTSPAIRAGGAGGAAVPAAAAAAAGGEAARGGIRIRRLGEQNGGGGEEPFNALVCLFHPKALTKDTPPFQ